MQENNMNQGKLLAEIDALKHELKLLRDELKLKSEIENKERFSQMVETINDVVYELDAKGNCVYVSPVIEKLTGFKASELNGKRLIDFVYPDDVPAMIEATKKMSDPDKKYYEFRFLTKESSVKWFRVSTNPVFKDGELVGGFGSLSDITDMKIAIDNLRTGDEKQRQLVEMTPDPVIILEGSKVVLLNSAARDFLKEYDLADLSGFEPWRISPEFQPDGQPSKSKALKMMQLALEQGCNRFEWLLLNNRGEPQWMDVTISKLTTSGGVSLYNVWRNITENKKNEQNLNFALQIARMGNYEYDLLTKKFTQSDNLLRLFGLESEDHIKNDRVLWHFIDSEFITLFEDKVKEVLTTKSGLNFEMRFRLPDNHVLWMKNVIEPVIENNKVVLLKGVLIDITDIKKAQEKLESSELKYRTLFETMVQGVVYQDANGKILEANKAAEKILGVTIDQIQGRTSFDPRWKSVHEDGSDFPGDSHPAIIALSTGKPVFNTIMGVFHPAENRYLWININAVPQFRNNEVRPYRVFTTFEDITQARLAHQKIIQSEEKLNLSQEIARMGSWEYDLRTSEINWSKNYFAMLGYQNNEVPVTNDLYLKHVHPDDRHLIKEFQERILETRKPIIMEIRMITRDGKNLWIENNIMPVFEGENLVALKGSNIDITSKKEYEVKIRQQNEKLNAIISAIPDILFVFDIDGNYLEFYANLGHNLMASRDKIIGTNLRDHFPVEETEFHLRKIKECSISHSIIEYEYSVNFTDGKKYFDARLAQSENNQFIAFVRDITDKKQTELEIKKLSQAVEQSPVMVVITDLDGKIEYVNKEFIEVTGYSAQQAIGKNPRIMKSGRTDSSVYEDLWRTIKSGRAWKGEWINRKKNGELYWEDVSVSPIFDRNGEMISYLAIKQDITRRKRFEKELQELNKNLEQKVRVRTEELALKNENLIREIAERQQLFEALLLSESRLELAMEAARMAWWEMNIRTGKVIFHQRKTDMLGLPKEQFNHYKDFMRIVHPDDYDRAMKAMQDHFEGKKDRYETEYRIKKKSGAYFWYHDIGRISKRDEDGKPTEIVGFVTEITHRKNIELALNEKSRELENFFNVSLDLLCIADLNGNFIKLNKSWGDMLGYSLHELENQRFLDFVHPDDIPATLEAMRYLNTQKPVIEFVNRYRTRAGNYRFIEWHSVPVGKTLYAAARDITESKFISDFQNELLHISSKLTGIPHQEIGPAINTALSRIGKFLGADRTYVFEFSEGFNIANNTYEWCAEGIDSVINEMQNIPTDLFPNWLESVLKNSENAIISSIDEMPDSYTSEKAIMEAQQIKSLIYIPLLSEEETFGFAGLDYLKSKKVFSESEIKILKLWSTMLAGLINNLKIESLLEQSQQNYETFFNTIDDFLLVYDKQGSIVHVNKTVVDRIGYTLEELKDHSITVIYPAEKQDDANRIIEKLLDVEALECSLPFVTKSGELILVESRMKHGFWNGQPIVFMVGKDISQIKLSEEKFSKAFHSNFAMMAISTYEENARFVDVNKTFLRTLGFEYEEVIGKTNKDLRFYVDSGSREELALRMSQNEVVRDFEVKFGTKSGEIRTGLFSADIVFIGNEKRYLTALVDITERKKMESELITARNEADEANKAKSEFLSRMSHELRTPMNSILGFAQLLEMSELTHKQMKSVKHILSSGKHLLDLINEVLDISRIESGRLSLSLEPVPVKNIIKEMIDLVTPQVKSRNLTIGLDDSAYNDRYVKTDTQRLKQVLLNLINNAIKYNHEGGSITIRISPAEVQTNEPAYLRISIIDTGIGISEVNQKKLFTPFERIGVERLVIEGTGLGLTVVKKLVEAMSGKVGVQSVEGKGSTFWIDLPLVENPLDHARKSGDLSDEKPDLMHHKGTILYVEDNASNVELIEQLLSEQRSGILMITTIYGKQAHRMAIEYKPDLILLDFNLPDVQGDFVLHELKKDSGTRHIPVIMLSADAMPRQISRMLKAGAMEYLTKPIDIVAFLEVIDEVFSRKNDL